MACSVRLLWERFVPEVCVPKTIPKWIPNPSKSAKNRSKKHFGDQGASRRRIYIVFCTFDRFLVAQGPPRMTPKPPNIQKTPFKNDGRKRHVFEDVFLAIFNGFWSQNGLKMESFFQLFWKRRFSEKPCFSLVKLMFFRFWASKNRSKIDQKT